MDTAVQIFWGLVSLWVAVKFLRSARMVPTQSAVIVERLGRYHTTLGPGFHVLIPFVDKVAYTQDLKEEAITVPPQDCFTKDNVQVEVDGVIYLSVTNAVNASYGITDYHSAAIQLAQTTTRSVIGTLDLDRTFEERDLINSRVLSTLGEVSEAWGIRVHRFEIKGIVPPASVNAAMERQRTAESERRALLARSEGEKLARLNDSEGLKQEMINRSEGEKQKRINEAEGRAAEILAISQATAESIEKMGASLVADGGEQAVKMRLSQLYVQKLSNLARADTRVVLPADLTNLQSILQGMGLQIEPTDLPPVGAVPTSSLLAAPRAPVAARPAPRAPVESATLPEMSPVKPRG